MYACAFGFCAAAVESTILLPTSVLAGLASVELINSRQDPAAPVSAVRVSISMTREGTADKSRREK